MDGKAANAFSKEHHPGSARSRLDFPLCQIAYDGNNLVRGAPIRAGTSAVFGLPLRSSVHIVHRAASNVSNAMKAMRTTMVLLLLSTTAWGDDAALLRCRAVAEGSARLACYDALVVLTSEEKARQNEDSQRGRFGLEAQDKTAPEAIESYIPGHFEGWQPGANIQLANGQVWQVNDNSRGIHFIDNPKVRVRHGVLSAYYLEIEGTNRSPRVHRVQ